MYQRLEEDIYEGKDISDKYIIDPSLGRNPEPKTLIEEDFFEGPGSGPSGVPSRTKYPETYKTGKDKYDKLVLAAMERFEPDPLTTYIETPTPIPVSELLDHYKKESANTMPTKTEKENWTIIDAVIATSKRVLLHGLPGTGKTYAAARQNLKGNDQKVYQITMTEETPAAEIRGHFLPKGDEMVWMDGPAVRAWKEGARLVINEIDRASADSLSLLYAILDDPEFAEFTLPTGEIVRPKKGFHTVATMNGEPGELPLPLQDRFPVTIEVIALNPEALKALPQDLQQVAKESAFTKDENRRLSIRMWMEFATLRVKLAKSHGSVKGPVLAAKAVFGKRWEEAIRAIELNDIDAEIGE
jgi:nitric oxide reductase NorQ protein